MNWDHLIDAVFSFPMFLLAALALAAFGGYWRGN